MSSNKTSKNRILFKNTKKYKNENKLLEEKNNKLEKENNELKNEIKKIEKHSEEYKEIIEKAAINKFIIKNKNEDLINSIYDEKLNNIENLENNILKKKPRKSYENSKNVVYIVTNEYKEAQGHYKIGKAQDLQKRLSVYNTSEEHKVTYYISCKTKKKMDILEQIVHDKLENKRVEANREWFESENNGEDFIKLLDECKIFVNE
jgi:hypothetical protein